MGLIQGPFTVGFEVVHVSASLLTRHKYQLISGMKPGAKTQSTCLIVKWKILDSYCACAAGGNGSIPRTFPIMLYGNPRVHALVDTCVIHCSEIKTNDKTINIAIFNHSPSDVSELEFLNGTKLCKLSDPSSVTCSKVSNQESRLYPCSL